tara:strand:+ start:232 stop:447 length:216 start_codon:yes stop_codon:yes gene_type:complete
MNAQQFLKWYSQNTGHTFFNNLTPKKLAVMSDKDVDTLKTIVQELTVELNRNDKRKIMEAQLFPNEILVRW